MLGLLGALPAFSTPAAAQTSDARIARWQPIIAEASARFGIPAAWIVRVMRAESGGNTQLESRPIRSRAGAIGLMQLMPPTWAALRTSYGLGGDPDDPRDNIIAGTAYLRAMYDQFGYPGLFAAYNAGPGRYAAYLARKATLPAETVAYLASVTGRPGSASAAAITTDTPPPRLLFVLRHDLQGDGQPTASAPADSAIFAIRKVVP